jgi:hypothetical protein
MKREKTNAPDMTQLKPQTSHNGGECATTAPLALIILWWLKENAT